MKLDNIFKLIEVDNTENGYQKNIARWELYYQGYDDSFHEYKEWNGDKNATRKRRSLKMGKKIAEDWADVLYNPETNIIVDEDYQKRLDEILQVNNFDKEINYNLEKGFGLGTMGIVTSLMGGAPNIQMVSADMLFPVVRGSLFGWAIISEYLPNIYYTSVHYTKDRNGNYLVENSIVDFTESEEGVLLSEEEMQLNYSLKGKENYKESMLQIIKPAIANNVNSTTPYGISVFANAIDELQTVDIAYSSLATELQTGKMLKFGMVSTVTFTENGAVFPDEEGFYIDKSDATFEDGTSMKTHSPTLRSEAIINTLETNLNLLGRKCGLGDNAYSFTEGSIYTNTAQVVSTNSKFYKTRQKHIVIIREALKAMVKAIYLLDKKRQYTGDVTIEFDDSIIHDKEQEEKELNFQYANGMISDVYYWMKKDGLTEKLAIEFVKKQNELRGLIEMPEDEGGLE